MARMLLLVHQPANARLLQHWLSLRYDVQVGTDATALGNSFDLAIVDGQTLDRLLSMIRARRLAEEPLFLPFMLITARRDVGLVTRHLWRTVDELLIRPVQKLELQARVEVLLRARDLSRQRYHILRSAGEGILQVGGNGRILWANPAAARMNGEPAS